MNNRYVLVTPVKDEILYFPKTIESVLNQEIKPVKWVIINDGSTDGTKELIDEVTNEYDWIKSIHNEPCNERKPGGEFVLKKAFDLLNVRDYDFVAKIDGDLSFEKNFFKDLLKEFEKNPQLGIGSGSCFIKSGNKVVEEIKARKHTRGAMKVYRTDCFLDIGGILPVLGWDTIDEMKAHQLGWETKTFTNLKIMHLKITQSSDGIINGFKNMGKASYYIGYHPIFMIIRGILKMTNKPYIIGGLAMISEFFKCYLKKEPQITDTGLKEFIRKEQIKKLFRRNNEWN